MNNNASNDLIKIANGQIARLSQQLNITNKIITQSDKYFKKITNEFTIRKAIKLARYSRFTTDGYYDPNEFNEFNEDEIYSIILKKLNSFNSHANPYIIFYFPKKAEKKRTAFYIPFEEYCIRFVIGIVLFDEYQNDFTKNIYGGREDIFSFKQHNSFGHFVKWQKDTFYSKKYKYLYSLDIKSFFDTINQASLIDSVSSKIKLNKSDYFYKLFKSVIQFDYLNNILDKTVISSSLSGIIVGSRVDSFFQNIVLSSIDNKLKNRPNIKYGRLTDDIKVFYNDKDTGESVSLIIQNELDKLGLKLNNDKSQLYDLTKDKIPFDDPLYYGDPSNMDISENYEIIGDGLSYLTEEDNFIAPTKIPQEKYLVHNNNSWKYKYDKYLISEIEDEDYFDYAVGLLSIDPKYLLSRHIDSLIFIIKKTNYSWRMCAFFVNTFFKISSQLPNNNYALKISNLLSDEYIDDYAKYRILRNLFLNNTKYYFMIQDASFEHLISEQLVLLKKSKHYILHNTAEFILKEYFKITTH